MPKQYKVSACLTCILALVFYLFWQLCKQQPYLAKVATFTEDPYDAVGSIGVQFAIFLALLTVVRAFRPYQPDRDLGSPQALLIRGVYLTCLSVAVTLGADVVGMLRYPAVWIGTPAGYTLAACVGGMALITVCIGWWIHLITRERMIPSRRSRWMGAIGISLIGASICAVYPQDWRQGFVVGGWGTVFILFTIVLGMTIFYTLVWVWGMVISPPLETHGEDFIDDLAALYTLLGGRAGRVSAVLVPFEKLYGSHPIVKWVNSPMCRWSGLALMGIVIGVALACVETSGEGLLHPAIGLLSVYALLECLTVLMAYAFFAGPLRLARRAATNNTPLVCKPE